MEKVYFKLASEKSYSQFDTEEQVTGRQFQERYFTYQLSQRISLNLVANKK